MGSYGEISGRLGPWVMPRRSAPEVDDDRPPRRCWPSCQGRVGSGRAVGGAVGLGTAPARTRPPKPIRRCPCPASWNETVCTFLDGTVTFDFNDYDPEGADEFLDQLCWPEPTNIDAQCGPVDVDVLRTGVYDGDTLYEQGRVVFAPVSSCN